MNSRRVVLLVVGWLLARVGIGGLIAINPEPIQELSYYLKGMTDPASGAMTEYPHAGVWPVEFLAWAVGNNAGAFNIAFIAACFVVDAIFFAYLTRRSVVAAWFWVVFGVAAGPVFVLRLDIFPALAVALCLITLQRFPVLASAALAVATAMKLWPGLLAAGLVGHYRQGATWVRVGSFVAALAGCVALTVVADGLGRVLSPLSYQGVRGLQIESISATPAMIGRINNPRDWDVAYASSKSFEVYGPGVAGAIDFSTALMVLTVLGALAWALWRLLRGRWTATSTAVFFVVVILALIVSNKVFSPQYITWLGPTLAICIAHAFPREQDQTPARDHDRAPARGYAATLGVLCIAAAILGTIIYPMTYSSLLAGGADALVPTVCLAIRNALIIVMAFVAASWLKRVVTKTHD